MNLSKKDLIVLFCLITLLIVVFFISNSLAQEAQKIQNKAVKVFVDGFQDYEKYIKTENFCLNYAGGEYESIIFF